MMVRLRAWRAAGILGASALLAAQTPAPQRPPAADQKAAAVSGSVQEQNDAFVQTIMKQIAGHETEPAEKVFKNIQIAILKPVPANRFLAIMNRGYSRALGVTCTHCHDEVDFASDDKRPKKAAREMAAMHMSINEQLSKMQNLDPASKPHVINCSTCHRGAVNPMAAER